MEFYNLINKYCGNNIKNLVGVGKASHSAHDAKYIVVSGVDADFSGLSASDGSGGNDELKCGVVNAREVASARWLVLLWAEGERVNVNASVWVACVMLEGLYLIEVGSFALTETVLSVKLEFASYNWVFAPAVHVEGSLGKNEDTSVGEAVGNVSGQGPAK